MKTIVLPAGTAYIKFDGENRIVEGDCTIGYWMARANFPDESMLKERMDFDWKIGADLLNAVRSGELRVRQSFTKMPLSPGAPGSAVLSSVVSVDDLRRYLSGHGYAVAVESIAPDPKSVPTHADAIDLGELATSDELIKAFGVFTGMEASWFKKLSDKPVLLAARKRQGCGQRAKTVKALFCPFEVMQWLINPKRKVGDPISMETGWRRFEDFFPRSYQRFEALDPREDRYG